MKRYIMIAKNMLNLKNNEKLSHDLEIELNKINELCERTGGSLQSRQLIASIIVKHQNV